MYDKVFIYMCPTCGYAHYSPIKITDWEGVDPETIFLPHFDGDDPCRDNKLRLTSSFQFTKGKNEEN